MKYIEAKEIVKHHAYEGVAYTSRFGEYPSKGEVKGLVDALTVILKTVRGHENIERALAGWLFTISDQIQGNLSGAETKGIELNIEFNESDFFQINEIIYAIFEH